MPACCCGGRAGGRLSFTYRTFLLPGVVGDADPRQRGGPDGEVYRQPPARVRQEQLALVAAADRRQAVGARQARVSGRRTWVGVRVRTDTRVYARAQAETM